MFSVNQLYDYVNNAVFELGGQSLALTWRWDRKVSKTWWLRAQVQPTVAILWAVQSDITEEAEDRSYDFGSGGGTRALLSHQERPRLAGDPLSDQLVSHPEWRGRQPPGAIRLGTDPGSHLPQPRHRG